MRKQKGITLVALIITHAVMLILVAVSVNVIVNSDSIGHTEKTGDAYKNAIAEEEGYNPTLGNEKTLEDYMAGIEKLPNIEAGVRAETNSNYKGVTIPKGFTVSKIPEEKTIDGGLVIYDIPKEDIENAGEDFWTKTTTVGTENYPTVQCNYNQFVWVPVETPYVTKAELDKIMSDSNGSITTEKAALQSLADSEKYPMAVELANGTDYRGVLYSFSAGTNKVNIEVMKFSTEANYDNGNVTYRREPAKLSSTNSSAVNQTEEPKLDMQTEYNKIVKSVKAQKGFWVARYELSYNDNDTKGESKRGKTVANAGNSATKKWYGLYNTCKTVRIANNKNEMQSNMIYGSQWDQIMIWMKEVKNTEDNSKYYILDSSNMGNYGTGNPQVSGYKNTYGIKQIFDLGGNLYDWTAEACNANSRGLRCNTCYDYGSYYPANDRSNFYPEDTFSSSSARVALYVSL